MSIDSRISPAATAARRRTSFLPFNLPLIEEDEIESVVETLRSGWITTGPKVKQFESEFRAFVDGRHTVAVNSATAALHLALEALGIGEGDEVLVPTMTFAATAEVVAYVRAVPVLVDCEADTLNMDPAAAEAAVTPRTRAMIPVHFGGHPCDMDALHALGRRHDIKIVEDAAHTLPAYYKGRPVGTMSDVACFSFYATKTITTAEGGMAVTADPALAERIHMMSLHGISRDAWKRYTAEGSWFYDIADTGFKYNLTDIAAALGLRQLAKCRSFWAMRRSIAARYSAAFADLPEIRTPVERQDVEHSWHLYVIQLDLDRLRVGRNDVIEALKRESIGTSVHFIPLHLHSHYRARFGYQRSDFPRASDAFDRILTLPLYPRMTNADVDDVIAAVRSVIVENRR